MSKAVATLFLDIGGVLLTNGWGRTVRRKAAETFNIDFADMDERHHLSFNTYEDGKLSLDQYLEQVVFHQPRSFSYDDFKAFMYAQSQALPDMIPFFVALKKKYHLHTVAVSNEGRELTNYRVKQFNLEDVIDAFVCSSFIHYRKPDADIYKLALDVAQAEPDEVIYIDDRHLFIEVASKLGLRSICHVDLPTTKKALAAEGLTLD